MGRRNNKIRYTRKRVRNKNNAIIKLDKKISRIQTRLNRGMIRQYKIELQVPRHNLKAKWTRSILVDPASMHNVLENAAWKLVFSMDSSPTEIYQTPKTKIHSLKLIQNFRLNDLLAEGQPINQPVTVHNYVVRLHQDAGSEWKQATQGGYTASHLQQDVHFTHLGGNSQDNIIKNSGMFFLNKKCFKILAQHHFQMGPYGISQLGSGGTAIGVGNMTNLKRYDRTYVDYMKLKITLKSAGNFSLLGNERGWTGITYQNVPATDQLFIITYTSQSQAGQAGEPFGAYTISHAASGLFYGEC